MSDNRKIDFRYAPDVQQVCIGLAFDDYKTIVREDGSLNYIYELGKEVFIDGTVPPAMKRVTDNQEGNAAFKYRFLPKFYHRDKLLTKHQDFGDPKAAIVTTTEDYVHSTFTWTIFAHKTDNGARMDIILFRLTAKDNFGHACDNVYLQSLGDAPSISPAMPAPLLHDNGLPGADEWRPAPSIIYTPIYCEEKEVAGPRPYLYAGDIWEGAFGVVYFGSVKEEEFTYGYAKTALSNAKQYWENLKPFMIPFHIPDIDLQNMLESSARNILQAMEIDEEAPKFRPGPTIYRGFWIGDTRGFTECAYFLGRDDFARNGVWNALSHTRPDGSINYIPGLFGETAMALNTLVRHCELENDDERLCDYWPNILRGVKYLRGLNEKSKEFGKDYPGYGLMPPSFGDGGLFGNEAEYSNPGYIITGLTPVYKAGQRLGLKDWETIKDLCDTLKTTARSYFDRDMKTTEEGIRYLPASMQYDPRHKPQLHIGTMLHFINNDDPLWNDYFKMLNLVDKTQGIPDNTGWRSDQSIFPYSSMNIARNLLQHGFPDKAIDYIYAFCNHAAPGRVWREEQPLVNTTCAEACGDMPHNWASALLINTVRYMLVNEYEDELDLLCGLPEEWLPTEGNDLILENTPTKFGKVSISMKMISKNQYEIAFTLTEGNQAPKFIKLYWRGKSIAADCSLEKRDGFTNILPKDCKACKCIVIK